MLYPNPASSQATLRLALPARQAVRVTLHDALGRRVRQLHSGPFEGARELALDTAGLPLGVYLVRVQGEEVALTERLTVVR